ncbi:MAG: hypothetical protein II840_13775 [Kiritimatiellae bacterium]|nr:hypothetical protein [Kiritimatiellia bacterium]
MNFEEFLDDEPKASSAAIPVDEEASESVAEEIVAEDSIDVQKAVVEALAADKAEQAETIAALRAENAELRRNIVELKKSILELTDRAEVARRQMVEQKSALEKVGDVLATNADNGLSNKVALLDRDIDIPDRFIGETRDHVLEVVREARDKAEAEGRLRRAQVLEGVLAANEPEGTLAKKRANLEKLFAYNGNIVSGPVIAELEKIGLSHKNGEDYLLPAEIIKRNY